VADLTDYVVLRRSDQGWVPFVGSVAATTREKALELALPDDAESGGEYRIVPKSAWGEVYVPEIKVERNVTVRAKAEAKPVRRRDQDSQAAGTPGARQEPAHAA
jgi:hypothetical protein